MVLATRGLRGITAPTLVVVGADDRATPPEHARRIASSIPGAQLRIVPDCGHSSSLEQPGVISDLLTEFPSEVDKAGTRHAHRGGNAVALVPGGCGRTPSAVARHLHAGRQPRSTRAAVLLRHATVARVLRHSSPT